MRPLYLQLTTAALLALVSVAGCSCDEDELTPITPGSCEQDFRCPTGFEYRRGQCSASRCALDTDCCPGQKCNAAAGFCADQYVSCTADTDCTRVAGQTCIDFRGEKFCGYPNRGNAISQAGTQPCFSNADCDDGRSCFGNRCLIFAPCGGGCPSGQICDVDSDTCFEDAECAETCGSGEILVVKEPDLQSGPLCCAVECACAVLPPVLPGQYGFHAAIGVDAERVLVSAYDPIYGDLVVATFNHEGQQLEATYVDGFPEAGPIVGNPDGPRQGRSEPGPKVGEYTSIVLGADGTAHVAYYDRDAGALKYAAGSGETWMKMTVDDDGDVGRYTSIELDASGNPWIAYMMVEGTNGQDTMPATGLKIARASVATPNSADQWTIELVDSRPIAPPPCGGGCPTGQSCVDNSGTPACLPDSTACGMDACASGESCVERGAASACLEDYRDVPLSDFIPGTGLFADLAFASTGEVLIAYYDRVDGDLRLARGMPGSFALSTIDGNDALAPTDVGQHVSLAIDPTDAAKLAYFDATSDDLIYFDLSTGTREIADNGVSPPDLRAVGADASLLFDDAGVPAIAYQDPTEIDLVYARQTSVGWSTEVLRGAPPQGMDMGSAAGFYAAQVKFGSTAFIASVDVSFDMMGNEVLNLVVIPKTLD